MAARLAEPVENVVEGTSAESMPTGQTEQTIDAGTTIEVSKPPVVTAVEKDPEPLNAVEFAARELGLKNGGIKLQWGSVKKHTGYAEGERKKFIGLFASKNKGGMTMEEAGERLMELDRENNTGFFDQSDPNAGLNAILDALHENQTMGELRSYVSRQRLAEAQREADAAYSAMMAEYEDRMLYEEVLQEEIAKKSYTEEEYNELMAILADEINDYETGYIEGEPDTIYETEAIGDLPVAEGDAYGGIEKSDQVLQETQPVQTAGERDSQRRGTDQEVFGENAGSSVHNGESSTHQRVSSATESVEDDLPLSNAELANEIFQETLQSVPDGIREKVSIRETSNGNEQGQNFIQSYNIDGADSGITRIDFFDTKPDSNPTWFIINNTSVDDGSDLYSKGNEYKQSHPESSLNNTLEAGLGFRTFAEAYDFLQWSKQKNETQNPVAPRQVADPTREAQKREKSLATQLKRIGISHEQKQDMAFNAGKKVGDFFASREEYEAYAENATDLGNYNDDFERGVDESFAKRPRTESMISADNLDGTSTEAQKLATEAVLTALDDAGVEVVKATDKQTQAMLDVRDELSGVEMMTVYHGSPHKFDAFDHSHMGEGEGAQAHGWGTYVAKDRETSVGYARLGRVTYVGPKVDYGSYAYEVVEDIISIMRHGSTFDEAIQSGRRYWSNLKWETSHRAKRAFLDTLKPEHFKLRNLYTVEIPENDGSNYFDESNPNREQVEKFYNACVEAGIEYVDVVGDSILDNRPAGKKIMGNLAKMLGSDKAASEFMTKAGFVGIKYDGRIDGECYVIFNESDAKITDRVEFYQTPNGTVYGWTDGKKIYLTKAGFNPNTPIHEYTHIWAKAMMQKNPKGWQSIKDLLRGTPVWNEVLNDPNYKNIQGNEDAVASEVLSRISGKENAAKLEQMAQQMIDEAKGTARKLEARGLIQNIKDALNKFWNWVGTELFGIEKFESVEQVTDRVLWDLVNKTDLNSLPDVSKRTDRQGNPINEDGSYNVELIESIEDITDEDFTNPYRNIVLPKISDSLDNAIGGNGKDVLIKKNIFEKNAKNHADLTPNNSRSILKAALYSTNIYGQTQKNKRPNYWVAIKLDSPNAVVILEVANTKEYLEIIGWRYANDEKLEELEKQAAREGGQFLILTRTDRAAADLSTLPDSLFDGKDSKISEQDNISGADIQNAAVDFLVGEPRLRAIERAVNEEAAKLGVTVTYKTREKMAKGHENDKGYYNTKTGEIVVCTENAVDINDAIQTILHEAVAHKGLRQLMGDRFDEFINRVYESLDAETKAKVDNLAQKHYKGNKAVAMEEYMATLAESTDFKKNTLWDKIKSIFEDIINAILGRNDIKIGDNELRYILRASYNNMVNPRGMETVRGWAQDQMMREEYGIGRDTSAEIAKLDAEYMKAVEEGDMETAQRMVLEAAKLAMPNTKVVDANGNPLVVYHGGPRKFTKFSLDTFGENSDAGSMGKGFYFTSDKGYADRYRKDSPQGMNLGVFLNLTNPVSEEQQLEAFVIGSHSVEEVNARMDKMIELGLAEKDVINSEVRPLVTQEFIDAVNSEYDGVVPVNYNAVGNEFVAVSPSQIKSADPVTYDDEGNVIPLSERFNLNNDDIRYRTGVDPADVAREGAKQVYNTLVENRWQELQRQFQDKYQPVRIAIDAIQRETGNIPIEDYENYLLIQNQASSRSRNEIDNFVRRYYSPISEQINAIVDTILKIRGLQSTRKRRVEVYAELRQYLIAKHGLERNEYYQTHNTKNVDGVDVPDLRDYSGLTALFGLDTKDFRKAEEQARELVENFEALLGEEIINKLWNQINRATNKTLRHGYESGMISRSQYEKINSMFEFYIPLRGFDETTAEDVYSYAGYEGNRFNPLVK